nr:hypothetical protein [Tanacetum cinerariifolium]
MESLSPQVVSTAKLPILNPNEFDLWKIRIKQYFLMTNYSLWEVILNGDSPAPTRVIEGVLQPVAPTTVEQRLARKNELKARGTLLMALPDKHQLKFNTNKDAKTLMEEIKKRFGGNAETKKKLISQLEILRVSLSQEDINLKFLRSLPSEWRTHTLIWRNKIILEEQSLDDLFNNLKIYEAEVKSSSSASTSTQNIAFVSSSNTDSTNEPVSAAASVSAIDADDLEEMDLKWEMAMLTMEYYNCHKKGHFAKECRSPKDTRRNGAAEPRRRSVPVETSASNALVSQCDGVGSYDWSFQADEEPTKYALVAFSSSSSSSDNELRDNALVFFRQNFKKSEQERDDLKLKLEKFQTSSKNLSEFLASKTTDKTCLGYNSQVFTRAMFDCDDYLSSRSDKSLPHSPIYDRYQLGNGYHAVPPPYTATFMQPKPDLVFHNAPTDVETDHSAFTVKLSHTKPDQDLSHIHRPSTPIIEDWVSNLEDESKTKTPQNPTSNGKCKKRKACFVCKSLDHLIKDCDYHEKKMAQTPARNLAKRGTHKQYAPMTLPKPQRHVLPAAVLTQSKLVPITAVRPITTAIPKTSVTRPRHSKTIVTKPNSPARRPINRSPSLKASNFPPKVTDVKAPMVNVAKGVQGKWEWKRKCLILDHVSRDTSASITLKRFDYNDALGRFKSDKGVINSGCSRHMTGNMSYLSDFEELNGGYVAFGGNPKGGKISRKGKIRTGKLDFDDVYFVKELKFNLFSVSQMCDKKNSVLFTDIECLVLSPEFKLLDENQVLLRVPRENNMYNVNLKNIVPPGDLTCLFAKATLDESNLWHRRLEHINFKTMNKLVKGNLVRGLPSKVFENDHTRVSCKKGKQHRASFKTKPTKPVSSVNQPLYMLHMDLFEPTFVKILNKKSYCLVVTDDYSRSDNGTKFKNNDLNKFCGMKGIKREFSVPRTPQQNSIAKRKNRTLIEAARTMLADSLLPIPFWAEEVNTACYVQNRVLVTKPENRTPYELLHGRTPSIGFMRPFGCLVTILNTLDSLGKFDGMVDDGFLVGYSVSSKAFRAFNSRTRIVQETLHVNFLENKPNVAEKAWEEIVQQYVLFPVWSSGSTNPQKTDGDAAFDKKEPEFEGRKPESEVNVSLSSSAQSKKHDDKTKREAKGKSLVESLTGYRNLSAEFKDFSNNSINEDNAAGTLVPAVGQLSPNSTNTFSVAGPSNAAASLTQGKFSCIDTSQLPDDPNMPELEDITYSDDEDNVGAEDDFNNLKTSITVSPISTTRVHKDHPVTQIIGDLSSATQTRSMTRVAKDQGGLSQINNDDFHASIQEELLQFKMQKVWVLVDLPHGKRAIGHTQEEGIDYEEVFALVARIEAIRLFLAYASFMGFMVYQMDVNSDFLYGTIEKEVYVCQPPGFEEPDYPNKIYVDDIIFGSTNKDLCKAFEKLMKDKFQMSSMRELTFFLGLQVKQKKDRIFISQDKYVAEILRKFGLTDGISASTPVDTEKPLLKDPDGADIDVHTYRSMIDDKVLSMQDDDVEPAELQEVVEVVTTAKLITEVVTATSATITTATPTITVAAPTLTTAPSAARRRKGVVIRDPEESATPSTIIHSEAKSKGKGKGILVEEPKPLTEVVTAASATITAIAPTITAAALTLTTAPSLLERERE